jgi:signal transduction histidine kinase
MRFNRRLGFSARLLQFYFVLGILVLGGFWFGYSQFLLIRLSRLWSSYAETLSVQLENETQLRSRIYAKFMSRATEPSSSGSAELDIIFEEVIKKIDFPVVIADREGNPISHRNLPTEQPTREELDSIVRVLDSQYEPIPLVVTERDSTRELGSIHYGISRSTALLRELNTSLTESVRSLSWFSILQLLLLVGFVGIGVWGILVYKRREQEHIWTALAKETAHQLATPLSSFSAWLEMLRTSENHKLMGELEHDLGRMREVLDRFSRIGMPPELNPHRIGEAVTRAVDFVRRRAPKTVEFTASIEADPVVRVDEVLFSWVLENLLKNSVDAIGTRPGAIAVTARLAPDRRSLELEVADTGEGVKVDKVFTPGVTTKKHGWGVGLPLAKRIVERYHGGRLVLKESVPGRTVFSIYLPVEKNGVNARSHA